MVVDVDQNLIIAVLVAVVVILLTVLVSRNPRTQSPSAAQEPQDMDVDESNFSDEVDEEEKKEEPQPAKSEPQRKRGIYEEGFEETFAEGFEDRRTKSARTMSTQSQVKYTWWTSHPRFTPLGVRDHGAWTTSMAFEKEPRGETGGDRSARRQRTRE